MISILQSFRKWFGNRATAGAAPPTVNGSEESLVTQLFPPSVGTSETLGAAPVCGPSTDEQEIRPEHDFYAKGLPPDWWARRNAVLRQDDVHCQVTGCINTTGLDVHHIKPRFEGPNHRLENLVTLCRLHHSLLPFHHETKERFNSRRYTSVSAHWRWNIFRTKRFPVRPFLKRYQRATLPELARIKELYGLACECGNEDLRAQLNEKTQTVRVRCPACQTFWVFERGLHEEIGVQMASMLTVRRNEGRFPFEIHLLEVRKPIKGYACLDCARNGWVRVMEKKPGKFGPFWGCPKWEGNKDHYTRPWGEHDQ